jgi:hypothetical protein
MFSSQLRLLSFFLHLTSGAIPLQQHQEGSAQRNSALFSAIVAFARTGKYNAFFCMAVNSHTIITCGNKFRGNPKKGAIYQYT